MTQTSTTRDRMAAVLIVLIALVWFTSGTAGGTAGLRQGPAAAAKIPPPASFQPLSENLYVPIRPCRIVDTRIAEGVINGTPFDPSEKRVLYVGGTGNFENQGGKAGGCEIPVGAVAITANFIVVSPSGAGRIHAWSNNGQAEPTATTYYYANHTGSSSATVPINPLSAYSLYVRNYTATTDLVIDVSGYYVKPMAVVVADDGTLYSGSSRALGSTRIGVGQYRITFDTYVRNCTVTAGGYAGNLNVGVNQFTYSSANQVEIRVFDADSGAAVDAFANVHVTC